MTGCIRTINPEYYIKFRYFVALYVHNVHMIFIPNRNKKNTKTELDKKLIRR